MSDKDICDRLTKTDNLLREHVLTMQVHELQCELKEKEAEKAHYIKENDFLKESLKRLLGI